MKTKTLVLLVTMTLLASPFVFADEHDVNAIVEAEIVADITEIAEDEDITATDLGIDEPTLLPDSPFYFLKNWKRGVQSLFTFDKVKKAELDLDFASERIKEAEKMAEETGNEEIVEKAVARYESTMARLKERTEQFEENHPDADRFLDKFTDKQIKHQKLMDKLAKKLPEKSRERVLVAQDKSAEHFANAISRLDDPEKLKERLDRIGGDQRGSKYKHFKNLEVLLRIEEKLPEESKEAVRQAQENAVKRLHGDLDNMSPEDQERFKDYLSRIGGDEVRHDEIIDRLEGEDLSGELRVKIKSSRDRVIQRIERKVDSIDDEEKKEIYLKRIEEKDVDSHLDKRIFEAREKKLLEIRKNNIEGEIGEDATQDLKRDAVQDIREVRGEVIKDLRKDKVQDLRRKALPISPLQQKIVPGNQ